MVSHMNGESSVQPGSNLVLPERSPILDSMASGATTPEMGEKVWRYMSFSRFLWLLQNKQLWLTRADLLGDPWEISLAGNQLEHVISRHPPTTLPLPEVKPET